MTITAQIAAQSIGTGANVGSDKFAQKLAMQSTTTSFGIELRVTNGAAKYPEIQDITMFYAVSAWDVTAAAAVSLLRQHARYCKLVPGPNASDARSAQTVLEPNLGGIVYCWFEIPNTVVASLLAVNIIELP